MENIEYTAKEPTAVNIIINNMVTVKESVR